jgi:hypothetical protein
MKNRLYKSSFKERAKNFTGIVVGQYSGDRMRSTVFFKGYLG